MFGGRPHRIKDIHCIRIWDHLSKTVTVELEIVQKLYLGLIILKDKGCWTPKDWSIYYSVTIGGKAERAHRVSYRISHKDFDEKKLICHHCDRPGCRNPGHLFQGTYSDNKNDALKKGRMKEFKIKSSKDEEERQYINGIHWKNLDRFAGE